MAIFDFFKKKENNKTPKSVSPKSELFLAINKYSEYIVRFIGMQQQGNYAPFLPMKTQTEKLLDSFMLPETTTLILFPPKK